MTTRDVLVRRLTTALNLGSWQGVEVRAAEIVDLLLQLVTTPAIVSSVSQKETPMTDYYTVVTEFENREDAIALADIIRELGFEARVSTRQLEQGPRTPMRDTRMGKIILRHMTPVPGASPRTFTLEDVGAALEAQDYRAVSASPALSVLVAQGDVKKVATGLYRVIAKP